MNTTTLLDSLSFTEDQYDAIASSANLNDFQIFISNIISSVKDNNGSLDDAIFIAEDAFKRISLIMTQPDHDRYDITEEEDID